MTIVKVKVVMGTKDIGRYDTSKHTAVLFMVGPAESHDIYHMMSHDIT